MLLNSDICFQNSCCVVISAVLITERWVIITMLFTRKKRSRQILVPDRVNNKMDLWLTKSKRPVPKSSNNHIFKFQLTKLDIWKWLASQSKIHCYNYKSGVISTIRDGMTWKTTTVKIKKYQRRKYNNNVRHSIWYYRGRIINNWRYSYLKQSSVEFQFKNSTKETFFIIPAKWIVAKYLSLDKRENNCFYHI